MFPIIDLHCHPSLKIYLCNKDIAEKHYPVADILPGGMHVDLPGMQQSNVRVVFASHYVPEAGLGHLPKSQWLFKLLKKIRLNIVAKFESDVDDNTINKTLTSFDLLDHQIGKAENNFSVIVAKNLAEFEEAYTNEKTILLHSIEGAHHLGKNTNSVVVLANLARLKDKGLCMFTLAHFFQNVVCDSGGGIPPKESNLIGYQRPVSTGGLTITGKLIVEWCQENGVIVDLVHATVDARKQVYDILDSRIANGKKVKPVIFSHSGLREVAAINMKSQDDQLILPDISELLQIKKYGGVLGLILMNYWIIGIEEDNPFKKDKGIKHLLQTIEFIQTNIGDLENVAIGTDLDGFTQVPDDISHIRLLGRLRDAIIERFGEAAARKICYENALRVIRAGLM